MEYRETDFHLDEGDFCRNKIPAAGRFASFARDVPYILRTDGVHVRNLFSTVQIHANQLYDRSGTTARIRCRIADVDFPARAAATTGRLVGFSLTRCSARYSRCTWRGGSSLRVCARDE